MKRLNVLALVAATIFLSGCCSTVSELPNLSAKIPPEPQYPSVSASELSCLTQEAYEALVTRDVMCRERIRTLEDIIRAVNPDKTSLWSPPHAGFSSPLSRPVDGVRGPPYRESETGPVVREH